MVLVMALVMPLSMGMRQCEDIPKDAHEGPKGQSAAERSAGQSEGSGHATGAAESGGSDQRNSANQSSSAQSASSGWMAGDAGSGSANQSESAAAGGGGGQGNAAGHNGVSGHASTAGNAGVDAQSGAAGQSGQRAPAAGSSGSEAERCGIDSTVKCDATEYCKSAPDINCGSKTIGGVCTVKYDACADIGHDMCGCDNRTYSNECEAHEAGVALRSEGACSIDDCKAAGGRHVKVDAPTSMGDCDENEESWPVGRGLDAEYNFCCRAKRAPGKKCGGQSGVKCASGEFCSFDSNNTRGCDVTTDAAPGLCEPIPRGWCSRDVRPVCGCDGRTYNNACEAHMAAISVKHQDACTILD